MRKLWEKYDISEVVEALLEWGYGSGEEFLDWLTSHGLTESEAQTVIDLLGKAQCNRQG